MNAVAAGPDPDLPSPSRALLLARWLERRLHDTMAGHSPLLRLFALDVLDADELDRLGQRAARSQFVAEAPSLEVLAAAPGVDAARESDGLAIVSTRWIAAPGARAVRPGEFPRRRRARVVQVVVDEASATVARFDDAADVVVIEPAA